MASDLPAMGLLNLMISNTATMRAEHYRREAEKYRGMAAAETDYKLHSQLLELAQRYDELAARSRPCS
jgi:hypothetical protein